ncbi:MAG: hypothetical protein K0R18_239 [Bacillales bacterium]|jgi:hypothetical protein|nr:hypothetical protein [Bacillales bacterium]
MFTGVNICKTNLLVEFDFAEPLQDELDNMLVMANLLGYSVEYIESTYALFINLNLNGKLAFCIQFSHDKSRILNCVEICATGEKFELMKEKLKIKNGIIKTMSNYAKAIRKTKTLL